jgi:hypothetical protein
MKNRLVVWLVAGVAPALAACAATHGPLVLGPVGPEEQTVSRLSLTGYLKVYTATEQHNDGDTYYYPHAEYFVYSPDNKLVKRVANAISIHDEEPELVELPAGTYIVLAPSESYGMVRVKAIVQPGEQTTVNLEYQTLPAHLTSTEAGNLVRLPNGSVVGTRANEGGPDSAHP